MYADISSSFSFIFATNDLEVNEATYLLNFSPINSILRIPLRTLDASVRFDYNLFVVGPNTWLKRDNWTANLQTRKQHSFSEYTISCIGATSQSITTISLEKYNALFKSTRKQKLKILCVLCRLFIFPRAIRMTHF